ncbi:MAG: hypothetical protein ACTTKY_00580 [Catonella sp.]
MGENGLRGGELSKVEKGREIGKILENIECVKPHTPLQTSNCKGFKKTTLPTFSFKI